jgi:hypothetical protein
MAIIVSIIGVTLIALEDTIIDASLPNINQSRTHDLNTTTGAGDSSILKTSVNGGTEQGGGSLGNGVVALGALLYGLYEVLYTKYAVSHGNPSMFLANQFTGTTSSNTFIQIKAKRISSFNHQMLILKFIDYNKE